MKTRPPASVVGAPGMGWICRRCRGSLAEAGVYLRRIHQRVRCLGKQNAPRSLEASVALTGTSAIESCPSLWTQLVHIDHLYGDAREDPELSRLSRVNRMQQEWSIGASLHCRTLSLAGNRMRTDSNLTSGPAPVNIAPVKPC